jgi:hypothetical protein
MSKVPDQSATCISFGNREKDYFQLQAKKHFVSNWKNWKKERCICFAYFVTNSSCLIDITVYVGL